jgi:hypothetical protein
LEGWPIDLAAIVLTAGFAYAAWSDWQTREVSDRLWQALSIAGVLLGIVALGSIPWVGLGLWLLVAALALEHLFPWDSVVSRWGEHWPDILEVVAFLGVILALAAVGLQRGIGTAGVPLPVIEAFAGVALARGFYELRLLYGGADAKALIAASVTLPLGITPLLALPPTASAILAIYPFPLTLLMNAALAAIAIPIALAIGNLRRGEFSFPRGFTGYSLPVPALPDRFVWLKDPALEGDEEEAETTEEDRALRTRQRDALLAQGVRRAWVSPQIPFLVLMLVGLLLGLVAGNLVFDLLALV